MNPVYLKIMDVSTFITEKRLLPVTSSFVKDSSTGKFDDNGLFSERIFGEIGSVDRLGTHGYIELNTTILNATIFRMLCEMNSSYEGILNGSVYARYDSTEKDFIKVSSIDRGAETGYSFFMRHISKVQFKPSDSDMRNTRARALVRNKDRWFLTQHIVIPAGLRDYQEKDGRGESDEINVYYRRMLEVASTLENTDTESPIFDNVRWNLQRCANEVETYLLNYMEGKTGFMQKKYARRSVARATRNVFVATEVSSPDDNPEAAIAPDEALVPLVQITAASMPLFKYNLRTIFFNNVFTVESDQAPLIDASTYKLVYVPLTTKERSKFITSDKMEAMISVFRDEELRHTPVTIVGADHKPYYLQLVYQKDGDVYLGRSLEELQTVLKETGIADNITKEQVRPLTYYEMYYIAGYQTCLGRYITVTRYPYTSHRSTFPARINLATTTSYEKIKLHIASNPEYIAEFPRWPKLNASSINGVSTHPSQLINIGADKRFKSVPSYSNV